MCRISLVLIAEGSYEAVKVTQENSRKTPHFLQIRTLQARSWDQSN